jgi:TRAP-type uncharacterized transport system substrate-binding protein
MSGSANSLSGRVRRWRRLGQASWWQVLLVSLPTVALVVAVVWMAVAIFRPAPPDTIRLIGGPDGSIFRTTAERYKQLIERYGVNVEVLASHGSLDNLQRLADPKATVDVGFVQSGLAEDAGVKGLVSLGTMFAQPLMVYHRLSQPLEMLSQLKGKRLAVGPVGSGSI